MYHVHIIKYYFALVIFHFIGCSVVACSCDSDYNKFTTSQRETICFMLFHLINWFREIVTTFSVEKDPEMRAKVIMRLQTITELHHLLEEWINGILYIHTYIHMYVY